MDATWLNVIRAILIAIMVVLVGIIWSLHKDIRECKKSRRERQQYIRKKKEMLGMPFNTETDPLLILGESNVERDPSKLEIISQRVSVKKME